MKHESPEDQRALQRIRLELANRHVLILLHGLLLVEVGIVMIMFGAPDFFASWFGPHARVYLGLAAVIPGCILLIGAWLSDEHPKGYWLQILGLAGVVGWQGLMVALYSAYVARQGVSLLGFNEAAAQGSARAYVPLVYTNILLLALVHLVTLIRLGRPPR